MVYLIVLDCAGVAIRLQQWFGAYETAYLHCTCACICSLANWLCSTLVKVSTQMNIIFPRSNYAIDVLLLPKDFIKKAYGTDKPVEPNLETASAVAAQMKYTPVRDTSLLLAESLGMSKKKRQLKVSSDIDINGELLAGLAKLVSQAKNMDSESSLETRVKEAARPSFKEKRSFSVESITKSNSQSSLASLHLESPHTEIEPLPLPAAPEGNEENEKEKDSALLELPVSKPEAIASGQMEKAKEDSKPTLEDFEQQAYDELQGKTVMKRPSAHPQMMKKPAACTKQTLAAPDTKEPKAGSKRKAKLTCYGCSRCRGNPHGCSSCAIESYKGERLNGREAWKKFMHKKQRGK